MALSIARALRFGTSSCVAFVGAGGKTTAMFNLARVLRQTSVIVTSTTHLGVWQTGLADRHIPTGNSSLAKLNLDFQGVTLITGVADGDRTKPISNKMLHELYQYSKIHSIPLLIEADGSRQKPLKAWAQHEPPIPGFADLVVQVVGLSGLGKSLTEEYVHRAEMFAEFSGLDIGEAITAESLIKVLCDREGGLKHMPQNARRVILLNQADDPEAQSIARGMTASLLSSYQAVVIASLINNRVYAIHEPIAGVILAAGESKRFGKPKQLLDWKGQPFVRAVAQTAIQARLSPVIVVTGANAEQVEAAVKDLDVKTTRNEAWESGQGSSIRAGIKSLSPPPFGHLPKIRTKKLDLQQSRPNFGFGGGWEGVGGAIFLLADQPQVGASVIQALKEKHAEGLYPILAPVVMDKRANPVLFDSFTFPDLMSIEGDTGGRAIFHKHRVEYLPWHDEGLLLDVDTPEQYQRLISNEDL